MSIKSDQELECSCLARYYSAEALNAHIEEQRSRERYHIAEAERCRTHTRIENDTDDRHTDAHHEQFYTKAASESEALSTRKPRICPHPACFGQPGYASRLSLRRHFLQHIECIEDCVACHEIFRLASKFIRHIEQRNDEQHNNLCKRKATYIKDTCQDLRDYADQELDAWENGEKRPQFESELRPVRRAKLSHEATLTDSMTTQSDNVSLYPPPTETTLRPVPNVPVHLEEGFNILNPSYSTHADIPNLVTDQIEIAPILTTINFPQWPISSLGTGNTF